MKFLVIFLLVSCGQQSNEIMQNKTIENDKDYIIVTEYPSTICFRFRGNSEISCVPKQCNK